MPASAAQLQFAAEFITFLAATAGLALASLRGELFTRSTAARIALVAGFALVGVAAFASGALLVEQDRAFVVVGRGLGLVALAAGTTRWSGSNVPRRLLWLGLAVMGVSMGVDAVGGTEPGSGPSIVGDLLLAAGSAAAGAAVLAASRRSIAARVAASAGGTLLLVVLVLSVALSAVLSSTVEDEAIRRLDARAAIETALVGQRVDEFLGRADLTARVLVSANSTELLRLTREIQPSPVIDNRLSEVANLFPTSPLDLVYLAPTRIVLGRAGLDLEAARALADSGVVRDSIAARGSRSAVEITGRRVTLVAASPIFGPASDANPLIGLVVATAPLDEAYLSARGADDQALEVGLAGREGVLATIGGLPATGRVADLIGEVLKDGSPRTLITDDRFVAARAITDGENNPVVALVVATPTTIVAQTRESLFRTLFLIALGGTLLALLIASLVGERVGGGLRRLTLAAEGIRRGDLSVRAGLQSDDEVGVLGEAFDEMASSIQDQTVALHQAADDETRLRNRLEAVVAGMGEALVAVDADGRITDFNRAAEELVGMTAGEASGRPADRVLRLVADDGSDLSARLRKPSPKRWSAMATVPSGDHGVPVAVSAGALRGPNGELAGNVFVLRDLRREREVERMKTEFLSRVGHELRTPLTIVVGFLEILANRDVPAATARGWHQDMLASSKRLQHVVEMLEFFASSGAGRMLLRRERVDVRVLVDTEVGWWQEHGGSHAVSRRIAKGAPAVMADRHWLQRSLHELIDNAVKFSPQGSKVVVTAAPATRGRVAGVEVAVVDKGKGMSDEELERVFSEFVQGDASDTRSFGGLGLGLSLVQRVAEAHGGTVTADSKLGKGTTVTLWVPVEAP